ncbi:hypothetical protein PIB30_017917 [Stylosanthes scabra]|uniref:Uncharacterized protein n=1 Tax=Stylosanthes scabra TaxID=79078 RepID=A0ABU6Q8A8_9FABA|nr:hypothetical protein [Stylosanthes scabra]
MQTTKQGCRNRFRSSPPPKFKFMRDAKEKLYRRLVEEGGRKTLIGLKDSSHHHQHVTDSSQDHSNVFFKVIAQSAGMLAATYFKSPHLKCMQA